MKPDLLLSVVFVLSTLAVPIAHGAAAPKDDLYDIPKPVAIQGRKYSMDQSFDFSVGYIPTDTFNVGFPLTAGYRYALNSYLSWEVLDYSYVVNHETQTKRDLNSLSVNVQNVGLDGKLDYPRQLFITGFYYSPLYAKNLLFNSELFYSESSLFLGAGTIMFNASGAMATVAPGLATRFYISASSAMNLFVKDYFYVDPHLGINGILQFGIGLEYRVGLFGGATHAER